eukprot:gene17511-biopygen5017
MSSCHEEGLDSSREHPPRDMGSSETGYGGIDELLGSPRSIHQTKMCDTYCFRGTGRIFCFEISVPSHIVPFVRRDILRLFNLLDTIHFPCETLGYVYEKSKLSRPGERQCFTSPSTLPILLHSTPHPPSPSPFTAVHPPAP